MDLRKYAQEAVSEAKWDQIAKSQGVSFNDYLAKIKQTADKKLLSQLARNVASFKGFGGAELTGFQRQMISAAASQRLKELGYLNTYQIKKEPL